MRVFPLVSAALLAARARAVVVDVFSDNACSVRNFIRNTSTNFEVYSGSCAPADFIFPQIIAPDIVFLNVALDQCSANSVTVALYSGGDLAWGDPDSCNLPRLHTVQLTAGACVPVIVTVPGGPPNRQYRNLLVEYWRLRDSRCDPPMPPATQAVGPLVLRERFIGQDCTPPLDFTNFADRLVLPGVCTPNITYFPGGLNPFTGDLSLLVLPAAAPGQFSVDIWNNNVPGAVSGCGSTTSVGYLGRVPIMPLTFPTDGTSCLSTAFNPPAMGLPVPVIFSARLFTPRTYTTSRAPPADGVASANSAADAAAATAGTGVIVGSVGTGVAALAVAALIYAYMRINHLSRELHKAAARGSEWGAAGAPAAAAAANPAMPNPLSGVLSPVSVSVNKA
jgi:hypothetical protein